MSFGCTSTLFKVLYGFIATGMLCFLIILATASETFSTSQSESVNGDLQFLWGWVNFNPHKINNLEPIDKKSAQLITSASGPPIRNLVEIHSLGASGQMGEI